MYLAPGKAHGDRNRILCSSMLNLRGLAENGLQCEARDLTHGLLLEVLVVVLLPQAGTVSQRCTKLVKLWKNELQCEARNLAHGLLLEVLVVVLLPQAVEVRVQLRACKRVGGLSVFKRSASSPGKSGNKDLGVDVWRFRGGLVFKAHRLLYHSTLESNKEEKSRES